jgi:hypothetical protein
MGSARGHSVFLMYSTFWKAVQCAALTVTGSIGFDIGSDFSHCPPSATTRDYLNPPLIRGWLNCESDLIFRVSPECHPEQDPHHSRNVLNTRHYAQCPHEGSAHRPDTGIPQHSWDARTSDSRTCKEVQVGTEPAILVHTSDNKIRSSSTCRQASAEVQVEE